MKAGLIAGCLLHQPTALCVRSLLAIVCATGVWRRLGSGGVRSRYFGERTELEAFGLGCPELADVLVGCEALQGLQTPAEVVG
jgi:hypothetical protein